MAIVIGLSILSISSGYGPMGSQHYAIAWDTFANGGGTMSSTHYSLIGTAGIEAALSSQSANYGVTSGFLAQQLLPQFQVFVPVVYKP